jgi:hypothetical protein
MLQDGQMNLHHQHQRINKEDKMSLFKKDPPQQKGVPPWVFQMITPAVMAIILGLVAFIANGFSEELKEKANNETLKMYMEDQEKRDDRQWEAIQQTIQLQKQPAVQMEVHKRQPEYYYPPSSSIQQVQEEPPPLSPKEFNDYMDMTPERRAAFRKLHPAYANLPE